MWHNTSTMLGEKFVIFVIDKDASRSISIDAEVESEAKTYEPWKWCETMSWEMFHILPTLTAKYNNRFAGAIPNADLERFNCARDVCIRHEMKNIIFIWIIYIEVSNNRFA